jgi:hypothetical protein
VDENPYNEQHKNQNPSANIPSFLPPYKVSPAGAAPHIISDTGSPRLPDTFSQKKNSCCAGIRNRPFLNP